MMWSFPSFSQTDTIVCLSRETTVKIVKELIEKDYLVMENDSLRAAIWHLKDMNQYNGESINFLERQIDSYAFKDSVQTVLLTEKRETIIDLQLDNQKQKRRKGILWGGIGAAFVLGLIIAR